MAFSKFGSEPLTYIAAIYNKSLESPAEFMIQLSVWSLKHLYRVAHFIHLTVCLHAK